jgi:hypothetical protein
LANKRSCFIGLEIEEGNIWMLLFQFSAFSDGTVASQRSSFVGLRKKRNYTDAVISVFSIF